jgi:hypothetical protein
MTQNSSQIWKKGLIWLRLGTLIVVPIVLLVLPASYFDKGRPMCLSILLFNQECYGCGMTRSIMHLIHLEWEDALYYNPLGFVVFPLLAFVWLRWFLQAYKAYRVAAA